MIFDRKAEDGRYPDLPRVKQMRAAIRDMLVRGLLYFTDPKPVDHCVFFARKAGDSL